MTISSRVRPAARLEQRGEQVQQPFAAIGGVGHRVRRGYGAPLGQARLAASTPAAAAASNSTGSSAAGRPIDAMRRPCAAKPVDDADRRDVDQVVAVGEPARVEIGADARLLLAADRRAPGS